VISSARHNAILWQIPQIRHMKIILPSLLMVLFFAGFAQAQSSAPADFASPPNAVAPAPVRNPSGRSNPDFQLPNDPQAASLASPVDGGELLIRRVRETLAKINSISARVRYRVDLFGHQLVGEGIYLQQTTADKELIRLELKTLVGQHVEVLQMVGDGRYLWQYQDSGAAPTGDGSQKPQVSRIDVQRVRNSLHDPRAFRRRMVPVDLALAGLPRLVEGLGDSFRFYRIEASKLDTLPVWIASGSWQPDALRGVSKELAEQAAAGQPLDTNKLPPQMPEEVQLYVGQEDMFPYRVEYRRRPTKQGRGGGAGELAPILIVEFYEVRLNELIGPQNFVYQPGNAEILDSTQNFIKSLGVKGTP
jgi:hypothetical protein